MEQIIINQIGIGLFLLGNIGMAIYASMNRWNTTKADYILGNQSLGGGVLMMTLVATLIEAADIGISTAYDMGFISLLVFFCVAITAILLGFFVFPKLTTFRDHYTLGDVVYTMYGQWARLFVVAISSLFSLLLIVAQLRGLGEVAQLFGFSVNAFILCFGVIITLYTFLGGIRAVASTDILQFICIAVGFILFTWLALNKVGGLSALYSRIPQDGNYLTFWSYPGLNGRLLSGFYYGVWNVMLISPPAVQRMLMTQKKRDIRHMFLGFSTLYIFFCSLMFVVGMCLLDIQKDIPESLQNFGYIIQTISSNPIGQLLFLLAIISIMISTIDSFMNALASLWVNDLVEPMMQHQKKEMETVQWMRILVLGIGMLATLCALYLDVEAWEVTFYAFMLSSLFFLPFIAGVFGFKGSARIFWTSIATFFLSFSLLLSPALRYKATLLLMIEGSSFVTFMTSNMVIYRVVWLGAILLSSLAFFVAHYLENGKFVIIDREKGIVQTTFLPSFSALFAWLRNPLQWANDKVTQYGKEPYLLGIFLYISYMVPYITLDNSNETALFVSGLRGIGILLSTLLLLESIWPKSLATYFNLFYYITIWYCIPFVSLMTTLQDPQGIHTTLNIILGIILLMALVDWKSFFLFQILSIAIAFPLAKYLYGCYLPDLGLHGNFTMMTSIINTITVCLMFIRKKQTITTQEKYTLMSINQTQAQQLQVQQETHRQLADSLDPRSSMISEISKSIKELREQGVDEHHLSRIETAIAHLTILKDKSLEHLPLEPVNTTLKALIQKVANELKSTGWAEKVELLLDLEQVTNEDVIRADIPYLQQLLFKSVKYQYKYYQANQVRCTIAPATISYSTADIEKKSNAYQIIVSTKPIKVSKKDYHISQGTSIMPIDKAYLHTNRHITISHFGVMKVEEKNKTCVLTYVLPCDVREVRPKMKTFADEDLEAITQINDEADVAFLELADSKGLSRNLMERALRTCKHYHRGQKRHSGEPFYLHPLAVTTLLLDHTTDPNIIVAGLLHDIVEDTPYTTHQMTVAFGGEVTKIVKDITNLYNQASRKVKFAKQEVFAGLLENENKKALLVKLLDRKHNLQTIAGHKTIEKRKAVATETLQFFAPLAQKLGKVEIEKEFKNVCEGVLAM